MRLCGFVTDHLTANPGISNYANDNEISFLVNIQRWAKCDIDAD